MNRSIAIMQPYFLPYLGYFQLINLVDVFVFYDDVNYIKQGWIDRNQILVNGEKSFIKVPLVGASSNRLIKDIEIVSDYKWKNKILKTIESNYKKAPFFNQAFEIISKEIEFGVNNTIKDLNVALIVSILKYLNISKEIKLSSNSYENKNLKRQNRVIDICKLEIASRYINPIGGIELYDSEFFGEMNISLKFIKPIFKEYKHFYNGFCPGLSILDVLMHNSHSEVREMLKSHELL
jgi:hypothetical protein